MHLAYSEQLHVGDVQLSREESLHISKVLRLEPGTPISLTDGKGTRAEGVLLSSSKKNLKVEVSDLNFYDCPYNLELAISPPKSNEKFELILEKCTELGIKTFHPILSFHSERRNIKLERIQKILISAMKQSQKSWLPKISEPIKFSDFIKNSGTQSKFIAHCNLEIERESIKNALSQKNTLLVIGPEGDFSKEEVHEALEHGFKSVHLGKERLRTETAAIFATSIYHTTFSL